MLIHRIVLSLVLYIRILAWPKKMLAYATDILKTKDNDKFFEQALKSSDFDFFRLTTIGKDRTLCKNLNLVTLYLYPIISNPEA